MKNLKMKSDALNTQHREPSKSAGVPVLALMVLILWVPQASAQAMPDPMRPALDLNVTGGAASDVLDGAVTAPANPGLQSVRMDARGRRAALIDGHWYAEGARVAGAKLVSIAETQVVLRDSRGRQRVMKMFPEVVVRPRTKAASAASDTVLPRSRGE